MQIFHLKDLELINSKFSTQVWGETFRNGWLHGPNSTQKVKHAHIQISEAIKQLTQLLYPHLSSDITVEVEGNLPKHFYIKKDPHLKGDIVVFYKKVPIFGIEYKYYSSSFNKNSRNHLQTLMGPYAEFKTGIEHAHFCLILGTPPLIKKGRVVKIETPQIEEFEEYKLWPLRPQLFDYEIFTPDEEFNYSKLWQCDHKHLTQEQRNTIEKAVITGTVKNNSIGGFLHKAVIKLADIIENDIRFK